MAAIDTSTFLSDLGISTINTAATNQYEFYKGIVWSDASVTNDQYEFYQKLKSDTYRYGFYKTYTSEYSFYTTGSGDGFTDTNIVDFYTFYKYTAAAGTTAPPLIDLTGLVLNYKFNGDATDSSGNGWDGTSESAFSNLAYDYADFPGSNSAFGSTLDLVADRSTRAIQGFGIPTLANGGDLSPDNDFGTSWTMTCWGKNDWTNGNGNGLLSVYSGGSEGTPFGLYWYSASGGQALRYYTTTNNRDITGNIGAMNDDTWHHYVIRYSNVAGTGIAAGMQIYRDGTQVLTTQTSTSTNILKGKNGEGWHVGTLQRIDINPSNKYYGAWGGLLCDFTMWNRCLTTTEITTLANAANGPLQP